MRACAWGGGGVAGIGVGVRGRDMDSGRGKGRPLRSDEWVRLWPKPQSTGLSPDREPVVSQWHVDAGGAGSPPPTHTPAHSEEAYRL